jgi:hypothetical protein
MPTVLRHPACAFLTLLLFVSASPIRGDDKGKVEKVKIDFETQKSIDAALEWLKDNQDRDGGWGRNPAVTSFAVLAYMSQGHLPGQGKYGPEVAKGVRNLLAGVDDKGYLANGSNMYAHGMAALALTQVWGMTGDEEVKKVLKKSIDLIVRTQNHEGGWRYEPSPTGADISVTIMQVMALRGAKDSGLHVPNETMDKAFKYIKSCYDPNSGGYRYQPGGGPPGFARTAAGVCVQQLCGKYEEKEIAGAVKYMEMVENDRGHYWYGHYYAAHAFHQIGGKQWEEYYTRMRKNLLAIQQTNGSWRDSREGGVGPAYQTAIAVLILSVPTDYLPIYQR